MATRGSGRRRLQRRGERWCVRVRVRGQREDGGEGARRDLEARRPVGRREGVRRADVLEGGEGALEEAARGEERRRHLRRQRLRRAVQQPRRGRLDELNQEGALLERERAAGAGGDKLGERRDERVELGGGRARRAHRPRRVRQERLQLLRRLQLLLLLLHDGLCQLADVLRLVGDVGSVVLFGIDLRCATRAGVQSGCQATGLGRGAPTWRSGRQAGRRHSR